MQNNKPLKSGFFPHDYDSANDDKILQLRGEFGLNGYALFWMCLETMAKNEDGVVKASLIGGLSLGYGVTKEELEKFLLGCIKVGLFYKKEGNFASYRMDEHREFRKTLSDSGKLGAEKRWGNRGANSGANAQKEQKEKNIHKEHNNYKELISKISSNKKM